MQYKLKGELSPTLIKIRQHLENNTQFSPDGKIAYIVEDKALLNLKQLATEEGNEDEAKDLIKRFLSDMLQIHGVEISIKLSGTNFSVRSKNADVRAMALKYGGGGHENAAAFNITKNNKNISEIIEGIISEFQNQLSIKDTFNKTQNYRSLK